MEVDGVPNITPNDVPNVVLNVVPNVAPNVVANVVPNVAPNVVANVAPNVVANVIPNIIPNTPNLHPATWPVDTDLIFVAGTTRVTLTAQQPLLRSVMHDAFDRVRVYLLFNNAFPEATTILSMTRASLVAAAQSRERVSSIYQRLLHDEGYIDTLTRQYTGKPGLSGAERSAAAVSSVLRGRKVWGISPGALAYYLRVQYLIRTYCGRKSLGSNYTEFRCR
jgi:hypothetical protein